MDARNPQGRQREQNRDSHNNEASAEGRTCMEENKKAAPAGLNPATVITVSHVELESERAQLFSSSVGHFVPGLS